MSSRSRCGPGSRVCNARCSRMAETRPLSVGRQAGPPAPVPSCLQTWPRGWPAALVGRREGASASQELWEPGASATKLGAGAGPGAGGSESGVGGWKEGPRASPPPCPTACCSRKVSGQLCSRCVWHRRPGQASESESGQQPEGKGQRPPEGARSQEPARKPPLCGCGLGPVPLAVSCLCCLQITTLRSRIDQAQKQ